jgi:hypothetical protein
MDFGAFVQENKRWLIGCAIGALLWLIASSVVKSVYDPLSVAVSPRQLGAPTTEVYDQSALTAARAEAAELAAERDRLQRELAFVVADKYRAWSGAADTYLYVVGRDLVQRIQQRAADRDVQTDESSSKWDLPSSVDEIRRVLIGIDMIDEIQQRLFAAHDKVKAADPEQLGLTQIQSVQLEPQARRGMQRGTRRGEVDLDDLLEQQRVTFQFHADEATLALFLESCRQPNRTLVVDGWQVQQPSRPGGPCVVKATLSGIVFKQKEEQ